MGKKHTGDGKPFRINAFRGKRTNFKTYFRSEQEGKRRNMSKRKVLDLNVNARR